jgi:DNA-binding MarR family transcriptional regulator
VPSRPPPLNPEAHRDLQLLEAFTDNQRVSQRTMASRLGIALGLTNLYVKRLARKGYIKCVNVRSNRILYLITPKGIAAKARLTYEFVDHSLKLYSQARIHLRSVLAPLVAESRGRFVIYGTSEPAELAYISLRELGVDPVAILADEPKGRFLGIDVLPLESHGSLEYDLMIIATLEKAAPFVARLVEAGVPLAKLCALRDDDLPAPQARARKRTGTG